MKDSFKTFPCGQTPLCRRNDKGERTYCHKCTKPEEWKERIEKELRENFEEMKNSTCDYHWIGARVIKEILGE